VLTAELYRKRLGPLVCVKTQLRPEKKQGIEPKSDFVSYGEVLNDVLNLTYMLYIPDLGKIEKVVAARSSFPM